jgi:hypothetical protein
VEDQFVLYSKQHRKQNIHVLLVKNEFSE